MQTWFVKKDSAAPPSQSRDRSGIRVGIPKVLNVWSTSQFWVGFLREIGISPENIVFSSDTSEDQGREFGKGRGTVDCCYPVKCMSGHYGELVFGQKKKLDVILSPMIYSLPSFLRGHVSETLSCTRVMAGPENIRAGFMKESDIFTDNGIRYASPFVSMAEPDVVIKQMYDALKDVFDLDLAETQRAVETGYRELRAFNKKMRDATREILAWCARGNKPCVLILARPYHMDPGIGHEIESDLQAHGYPIVWLQYMPIDDDLLNWVFGEEIQAKKIRSGLDISDVWTSSNSSNTNEILWGAKFAARFPWITCVLRLSSYECGMDQPTYTPTQKIVEAAGTLFFKFGDLDSTKPAGSIRIRIETIVHYLAKYSDTIMQKKLALLPAGCPLLAETEPPAVPGTSADGIAQQDSHSASAD